MRIHPAFIVGSAVVIFFVLLFGSFFMTETVSAGHVAVPVKFGEVQKQPLQSGFHVVSPVMDFVHYDCRKKTHMEEGVSIPSQDKLVTTMDVSVQYRLDATVACNMLKETGNADAVISTHLIPPLRSILREQGKSVARAEEFFLEDTQNILQDRILSKLIEYCQPRGVIIEDILIRDITLPTVIVNAVNQTKERQEQTAREQAEFERFQIEQQKLVASASARRAAAEEEAAQRRVLADAAAYEIQMRGESLRENPEILKLEAIQQWDGILPRIMSGGSEGIQFLLPIKEEL